MPVCRDCKSEVVADYQIIKTKRKTEICICNRCLNKYRRGSGSSARDS